MCHLEYQYDGLTSYWGADRRCLSRILDATLLQHTFRHCESEVPYPSEIARRKLTVQSRTCPPPLAVHPLRTQHRPLPLQHCPRRIRAPELIDKFCLLELIRIDEIVERGNVELRDGGYAL